MIAEKEKKTARANTPRRPVRCPQKTGINLNLHEKRTGTVLTLLIGALCITVLALAVAKFGVLDLYDRLADAQSAYAQAQQENRAAQEKLSHFDEVLSEYRTYSMEWMEDGEDSDLNFAVERTEMLDLLGIGETAKAIVMCMVSRQTGVRLLKRLGRELEMRYPGRGIAFAIPITGIGLRWHKLLTAADEEQKEVSRMHETEKNDGFDVVAVVMERGYTNVAMDAARKAGARGGTVISARGIAENEVKRFFGIEIQAEKEIVFLVVRSDEKQQVMTALMQAVGMKTRSHGIVLSMPLSAAIGLAD